MTRVVGRFLYYLPLVNLVDRYLHLQLDQVVPTADDLAVLSGRAGFATCQAYFEVMRRVVVIDGWAAWGIQGRVRARWGCLGHFEDIWGHLQTRKWRIT